MNSPFEIYLSFTCILFFNFYKPRCLKSFLNINLIFIQFFPKLWYKIFYLCIIIKLSLCGKNKFSFKWGRSSNA